MRIMAHAVIMVIFLLQFIDSNPLLRTCETNDDCPYRHFCYKTGYCQECVNCSDNLQAETKSCAREFRECGDCLPGYIQDPHNKYFDGRKTCIPSAEHGTTVSTTPAPNDDVMGMGGWADHLTTTYICIAVVAAFCIVAVFFYWIYRKTQPCRQRPDDEVVYHDEKSNNNFFPSAPHLREDEPLNNDENVTRHHGRSPPPPYVSQIIHKEAEDKQRARPYVAPTSYIRPPNVSEDNIDSGSTNQPIVQEDENTQPSTWTPSSSGSERTNFSGILQENANRPLRRDNSRTSAPDEPPPKQSKPDNARGNIYFVAINNSLSQQSTHTNIFPTNVTNVSSMRHRDSDSQRPTRSVVPEDAQINEEISPNTRSDRINIVIRSNYTDDNQ